MHRGSSNGARNPSDAPEPLPLSASPARRVTVRLELLRGGDAERVELEVAIGTPIRAVLRSLGRSPEGSAVLRGEEPLPLDTPITEAAELTVLSTFSGG
jgi:sulfur carrier protein ThiS